MSFFIRFITIAFFTIGLVFVQTTLSQDFSYSGKVVNFAGEPIPGATVKLKKAGKSTKTANDGSFLLTSKSTTINGAQFRFNQANFTALRNGYLEIRLFESAPVSITVFSVGGKILYHKKTLFNAGTHAVSIPVTGQGVYLFRVKGGGQEVTFKMCSFGTDILGGAFVVKDYSARALSKQAANFVFDDSLFVTKTEYLDYQTWMYKKPTQSDLIIRMASVDHPIWARQALYQAGTLTPKQHSASILELPSGELLTTFFAGSGEDKPDNRIRLSRLAPGAEKWTPIISIADGMYNGKMYPVGNPSLFQEREGKLFVFYQILAGGRKGALKTSMDEGKTWSDSRMVCDGCTGPEKNKCVQLPNGTILAPNVDRGGKRGGGIGVEISKDGGETWGGSPTVNGIKAIQPAIMFHPGGRLQMIMRGTGHLPVTWSEDNGETWSKLEYSTLPANWSGIDAVTLRDGRHFVVYNHNPSSGKGPRTFLNIAVSKDGVNWSAGMVLGISSGGQLSYPAIIQARNGLVHVVHTWHKKTIAHIVINPYKITDETTVPMPDGKWPTSGPLSKGENKDRQ
ncbi:MAG: exo-alpha-sialidase, partial [Chitinispirillia bacterium]